MLIVLLYKGTDSNKRNHKFSPWAISQNYTGHTSLLCITFAWLACCWCLSHKFWIRLDSDNTTTDKKQSCDWRSHRTVNVARTPPRKWKVKPNWIICGKECGLVAAVCGQERCVQKKASKKLFQELLTSTKNGKPRPRVLSDLKIPKLEEIFKTVVLLWHCFERPAVL